MPEGPPFDLFAMRELGLTYLAENIFDVPINLTFGYLLFEVELGTPCYCMLTGQARSTANTANTYCFIGSENIQFTLNKMEAEKNSDK